LKVFANVKIPMQCFEICLGGKCLKCSTMVAHLSSSSNVNIVEWLGSMPVPCCTIVCCLCSQHFLWVSL